MVTMQRKLTRRKLSNEEIDSVFNYWLRLPDDSKVVEIINGEIIMTPGTSPHSKTIAIISSAVLTHTRDNHLGDVYNAALALMIRRDFMPEPDVIFVHKDRAGIVKHEWIDGPPDLVVEVLSPSTEHRDRGVKFDEYATFGVAELWLADTEKKTIEVYANADHEFRLVGTFSGRQRVRSLVLPGLKFIAREAFL